MAASNYRQDHATDEFVLLGRWRAGDSDAGDRLTRRYYPNVRRFFDVKVPHHAEDLTQRTFLACLERLEAFRGDATFKAYLFGIARFQLLTHLRTKKRQEQLWRAFGSGEARPKTSLSMIVVKQQEQHLLLLAYARLPTEQQIAVELFYWEDMTTSEIGRVLEIPVSTVTTRLSRARGSLRAAIVKLTAPGRIRDELVAQLEGWTRSLVPR
jgi:RNA polymerase sigma-70 factor (ECF subfamily)